jgi:hypothetical protein
MNAKQNCFLCAVVIGLSGIHGLANAEEGAPTLPGSKITLAPLPVEIYMQPGQKPAVVFSTPCIQIEKITHGFPPILAFENFMLEMVGKVNASEVLPVRLEPVCI